LASAFGLGDSLEGGGFAADEGCMSRPGCSPQRPGRESSRGGVPFGVEEDTEILLGSTILFGLDRDRLERWNDALEKHFFFLSSFRLSVSGGKFGKGLSRGAVDDVVLRVGGTMNSGSSDASREEGMESVR
jgi:hypothetical protein